MSGKLSIESFIKMAKIVHKDKYDYSLSRYVNNKTKIKIICKEHGEFMQQPSVHLKGQGCFKCGKIKSSNSQRFPINDFILESNNIHKKFYDYTLVNYKNLDDDIDIICPIHGLFKQRASRHLKGSVCPKCNSIKSANNQKHTKEDFIKKAKLIHGDLFDYSKVEYKNNKTKVEIICKKHGSWMQTPVNHINNKRKCPLCNESKGEDIINQFLIDNNIKFKRQMRFEDCKDIRKLSFDFYLINYNICIEYNGIHHYKPVEYFGGIKTTKEQQKRDTIKINYCKSNKIPLLIIKYTDKTEHVLLKYFKNLNIL